MKKLLTFIFILCTVALFAEMRGGALYDPGAARTNLSNVDAAATPSMTSITLSGKVKAAWADILGDIYASGTAKVSTGTAAAPAYTFSSDPNTGMYSPAADNLAVSAAGAEALRVNSAGEVLVATSTDAGGYKLQVNGNAYVTNDVSALTINGVAPLTAAEKTQALVGSTTVNFLANNASFTGDLAIGTNGALLCRLTSTLAPSGILDTGIAVDFTEVGILSIISTSLGSGCLYSLVESTVTKIAGHAAWSHSKGTASSINVYVESGKLMLQNNTTYSITVRFAFSGVR